MGMLACLFALALVSPFAEPPPSAGLLPLKHNPPCTVEAMQADVDELVRLGYGGVACNCPFDGYVARESNWPPFVAYVKALKARGLHVWLYDERGYPSGFADGLTLEGHPELQATGYLVATNGESFRIAPLFEGTHAQVKINTDRRPYPNILMREATERFLAVNHARYAERFGGNLGEFFVSTFTDEPSLMSHWLKPMPEFVLPHAPDLPGLYGARTGRRLEDDIKTLVLPDGSPRSRQVRYDFWNLVGERLAENFFGVIDDWCRAHGMLSGGHLMCEESFADHVGFYGDFLACLKRMSAPGIDMLTIRPPCIQRTTPLFAASARALGAAREAMVEISDHAERMAKPARLPFSIAEANGAVNLYIWGGITAFPSYLAIQRMKFPDETVRTFNRRTGRLVEWFSRPGEFAAETALVYPAADLKANYCPRLYRGGSTEIDACMRVFRQVEDSLYRHRRPCLIVDDDFLVKATVMAGRIAKGNLAFRTVILPNVTTLPLAAWRKLAALKEAGGVVIAVGRWPENDTTAFPSADVERLAERLFRRPASGTICGLAPAASGDGAGVYLPEACARLAGYVMDAFYEPLIAVPKHSPIRVQHRRMENGDRLFVFNDSAASTSGEIGICGTPADIRIGQPETGMELRGLPPSGGRWELPLTAYGGAVIWTAHPCSPARKPTPDALMSPKGAQGRLSRAPYETMRNLTLASERVGDKFHAVGTIVAAGADTYHWVNYDYVQSPFRRCDSQVLLDVEVPSARLVAGPNAMVFLKRSDGKSYLSNAPVSLVKVGRSFIVLKASDFRPFRHKEPLDFTQITSVAVGYGGWRGGAAGEDIGFIVRPPSFFE